MTPFREQLYLLAKPRRRNRSILLYVEGELARSDVRVNQASVHVIYGVQFVHLETCELIEHLYADIWNCNATVAKYLLPILHLIHWLLQALGLTESCSRLLQEVAQVLRAKSCDISLAP